MGEFLKEHIESIMMISFILATALGMYKVYVMFEKQSDEGIDIKTLEDEIIVIIEDIFKTGELPIREELLERIKYHADYDKKRYFNLNENRLNKILEKLYIRHKSENYKELQKKFKEEL